MLSNANDHVLASFDVSNLFTNVPLNETLSVIKDSLFENVNGLALSCVDDRRKLYKIVTKEKVPV